MVLLVPVVLVVPLDEFEELSRLIGLLLVLFVRTDEEDWPVSAR